MSYSNQTITGKTLSGKSFLYGMLKDPGFYEENRLRAHSDHAWYPDGEALRNGENPLRYSLNGYWNFAYARNEKQIPSGFEEADFDCRTWELIAVPAHIQMEGYDRPQYVNVQYPWDGWQEVVPGEIPEEFNPVACYAKYFTLPEDMAGKRVFLSFQGVESCIALWLNGRYVGFSGNSFSPCEFELTEYLVPGENKLAARVYKWSAGSWLEDQDFFRFSGIYRDVYLYAVPKLHIQDLKVATSLSEDYGKGLLCLSGTIIDGELDDELTDQENSPESCGNGSWESHGKPWMLQVAAGGHILYSCEGCGAAFALEIEVYAPRLWSAEVPNLYDLEITLMDGEWEEQEVVQQSVGFRRFEMKGGLMLLNGKRIVFKGVNRHDFSADVGRAVTEKEILRDLITMKRNNINAVRTSHYPDTLLLYGLCDRLGLYVIAENNMETHGTWGFGGKHPYGDSVPGDRMEWEPMLLDRVESTYQTIKNHPSVLIWSLGNESFGGKVIRDMARRFRELDGSRLIHYEGIVHDRRYSDECSDMESQMYTPAAGIKQFLAEHPEKPFICCEYTHSMGNSNGGMHLYTDLTDTEPRYQGGFIWDFIDQAIRGKDRYGDTAYFYGGDLGDRPADYSFSGNGICHADGSETPKMPAVKFNYQNISVKVERDEFTVVNKNLFLSTSVYDCFVTLQKDGRQICRRRMVTEVEPGTEKTYSLPFEPQTAMGEYAVTVSFVLKKDEEWAAAGHEVAFGQGVYRVEPSDAAGQSGQKEPSGAAGQSDREEPTAGALVRPPLRIVRGQSNIGIIGSDFRVLFSYQEGITSYQYGGKELLKAIPLPNFWRPMVENDFGGMVEQRTAQWKIGSQFIRRRNPSQEYRDPVIEIDGDILTISYVYYMPTNPVSSCKVAYTVQQDGTVTCRLGYEPVQGLPPMPEFGMLFKMDADYDRLEWYGNGPGESYCDRPEGSRLGIWNGTVREQMARYLRPQESGNHTGVRWAKVTDYRGRGLMFSAGEPSGGMFSGGMSAWDGMDFSVLPWTPHEIDCAQHLFELPPVHNTVVRCAWKQMGVGGDDTWGSLPHPEYWLEKDKPLEFVFSFKGV